MKQAAWMGLGILVLMGATSCGRRSVRDVVVSIREDTDREKTVIRDEDIVQTKLAIARGYVREARSLDEQAVADDEETIRAKINLYAAADRNLQVLPHDRKIRLFHNRVVQSKQQAEQDLDRILTVSEKEPAADSKVEVSDKSPDWSATSDKTFPVGFNAENMIVSQKTGQ